MRVAQALTQAMSQFTASEIDTPRLDAQLLLAWILKASREDLAREPERSLTARETLIFEKAVSLRVLRRPLPYITGEQYFYGRPFKLNRAVLIPRPETEGLVEAALAVGGVYLADIGTGSGCLAVTLACELPHSQVWATDISPDALNVAKKNAARHTVSDRVSFMQGDLLAPLPTGLFFDIIVSNPPYITELESAELQPEVRAYEPSLALTGTPGATGADGTALHRRLISEARSRLKPGGWLFLEVGQGQAETVAAYGQLNGYRDVQIRLDLSGIGRIVELRYP